MVHVVARVGLRQLDAVVLDLVHRTDMLSGRIGDFHMFLDA